LLIGCAALALGALASVAYAFWDSSDSSKPAEAIADSLQAGKTPVLGGINGQDVTISWAASTTAGGSAVTGYSIGRYSSAAGGTRVAATGGCSGTVSTLTCTEQNVPAGTWYDTVTPVLDSWVGAESLRSAVVTVVAPTLSFTANQTFNTLPATLLGGAITHFKASEAVTFHLDSSGGTVLVGSIASVGATGAASPFTVTVPVGVADGTHDVVAVGSGGSQAVSNGFVVDTTPPSVSITFPANNGSYNAAGWAGSLAGSASDATTGVASVSLTVRQGSGNYYDGTGFTSAVPVSLPASGTTGWSYALAASRLTDGQSYTITATATDGAGNTAPATAGFRYDTTPPAVTVSAVTSPGNNSTPAFGGGYGTALGDTAAVSVTVYNGAGTGGTVVSGPTTATLNTTLHTWSTPALGSALADGTYTVAARQSDAAGNTGTATSTFLVDTTPPAVTLTAPANGSATNTTKPTFSGAAGTVAASTTSSADSTTVTVKIYSGATTGGTLVQTLTATQSAGSWSVAPTTALAAGQYTAQASQSDGAGNTGTSSASTFTVTTSAAGLTFTSCSTSSGGTVTCTTTGTATVSLPKANQGGGTWTARVTLVDGSGNAVTNTGSSAISVSVTKLTSGATITYSSGTSLTIPVGASQSTNSFTYSNSGVANGGGSDTVTASSSPLTHAVASISW